MTKRKRWTVWRDDYLVNDGINPWVAAVRHPSGYGYVGQNFATHAEALAYADRMARTVEVALPRVVDDCVPAPGSSKPAREATWIALSRDGGCWVTMPTTGYVPIMVRKEELAPLALALLALHYRNQT